MARMVRATVDDPERDYGNADFLLRRMRQLAPQPYVWHPTDEGVRHRGPEEGVGLAARADLDRPVAPAIHGVVQRVEPVLYCEADALDLLCDDTR